MLFGTFSRSSRSVQLGAAAAALAIVAGLAGSATASTIIADWTLNAGSGLPGYYTNPANNNVVPADSSGSGAYGFYSDAYGGPTAGGQISGAPTAYSTDFTGYGFYGMVNAAALTTAAGSNFSIGLYAYTSNVTQDEYALDEYAFMTNNITNLGSLNIGLSGGSWVANFETSSGLVSLGTATAVSDTAYNLVVNDNSGVFSFVVNGIDVTPGGSVTNSTPTSFAGPLIAIQSGGGSAYVGELSDITVTSPAPEPASLGLVAAGGVVLLLLRRRTA